MFIRAICSALDKANVPYAVVGGYAVALHGATRGTVDVDVVIQWTLKNLRSVENVFKQMGLFSRIPVTAENIFRFRDEYIQNRSLIAWNFYHPSNPLQQVDVLINYDLKSLRDTKKVETSAGPIRILSLNELIKMKQAAGRPQDLEDIRALRSIQDSL